MQKNTRIFITSEQLAKAAGVSRATILRVEETGLIKPAHRDGKGNSRHYDIATALKLFEILNYHDLGFTKQETMDFFTGNADYESLLEDLYSKITTLNMFYHSIQNLIDTDQHMKINIGISPSAHYYTKKMRISMTDMVIRDTLMELYHEAIEHGCRIRRELYPALTGLKDIERNEYAETELTVCIPVYEKNGLENLIYLPQSRIMYTIHYGAIKNYVDIMNEFKKIAKENKYEITTGLRLDIIKLPHKVNLINSDNKIVRFYLPI